MADRKKDYKVGFGKTPKNTRFKKGQSGNPKGRPKGAKGVRANLKRELEAKITVREGNREIRISKAAAISKRFAEKAMKGEPQVLLALMKLDAELFGEDCSATENGVGSGSPEPVDYDILRDFLSGLPCADDEGNDDREIDNDGA